MQDYVALLVYYLKQQNSKQTKKQNKTNKQKRQWAKENQE